MAVSRTSAWSRAGILVALGLALLAVADLATSLGTISIPFSYVAGVIAHRLVDVHRLTGVPLAGKLGRAKVPSPQVDAIIFQIRLPRVLTATIVGAALAVAGTVFQGLLHNLMADPYVIHTSRGAALGAELALILPWQVMWFGFTPVPILAYWGRWVQC